MENRKGISFIWKSRASHYPSWSSRYFVLTIQKHLDEEVNKMTTFFKKEKFKSAGKRPLFSLIERAP